jgi:hypothetical protein
VTPFLLPFGSPILIFRACSKPPHTVLQELKKRPRLVLLQLAAILTVKVKKTDSATREKATKLSSDGCSFVLDGHSGGWNVQGAACRYSDGFIGGACRVGANHRGIC